MNWNKSATGDRFLGAVHNVANAARRWRASPLRRRHQEGQLPDACLTAMGWAAAASWPCGCRAGRDDACHRLIPRPAHICPFLRLMQFKTRLNSPKAQQITVLELVRLVGHQNIAVETRFIARIAILDAPLPLFAAKA